MSLQTLNSLLWNQRQLLETLIFKLEEEQLLLAAGKSRWLPRSTAEIEAVLGQIRESDLARAVESTAVCTELGIDPDSPLTVIAERAPDQWSEILSSHRQALAQIMAEVEQLLSSNRELLSTSQRAVQEALSHLDGAAATYNASGAASSAESSPRILDQNL
ncbi:flagellar protein FlgN [Timonella sp. A28]|uniref:flagellar protein FlgN n=1 Tax=Timonella sp. A28 TaxID=3442640 RepID=UPI003EBB0688